MSTLILILGVAFVVSLVPVTVLLVCKYLSFRAGRAVVCPHTYGVETVRVDAAHAAWTAVAGEADLKLAACSGAAHGPGCGESCLVQFERSGNPEAFEPGEPGAETSRLAG